jgi:hypothetical protein
MTECAICLEIVAEQDKALTDCLPSAHVFHKICLFYHEIHSITRDFCPMCRCRLHRPSLRFALSEMDGRVIPVPASQLKSRRAIELALRYQRGDITEAQAVDLTKQPSARRKKRTEDNCWMLGSCCIGSAQCEVLEMPPLC